MMPSGYGKRKKRKHENNFYGNIFFELRWKEKEEILSSVNPIVLLRILISANGSGLY